MVQISVIVIAYNRRQFLLEALRSVTLQTIDKSLFEVIVIKNFYDVSIDGFINDHNMKSLYCTYPGIGKKVALALKECHGEIISILEDDDTWSPTRLQEVLDAFQSDGNLLFYKNDMKRVDRIGTEISRVSSPPLAGYFHHFAEDESTIRNLLSHEIGFNSSITVRRAVYENFLAILESLFFIDIFPLIATICSNGSILFEPKRLTNYRVHESISNIAGDFDDFVTKQRVFSERSMSDYRLLLKMPLGHPLKDVIESEYIMWQVRVEIFSESFKRHRVVSALLRLVPTLYQVRNKVVASFLLVAVISLLVPSARMKLFHFVKTRIL